MPYYRRRPTRISNSDSLVQPNGSPAKALTRALTPLPGAKAIDPDPEGASLMVSPEASPQFNGTDADLARAPEIRGPSAPRLVDEAAALVPRAASILDEEMSRGVLAAKSIAVSGIPDRRPPGLEADLQPANVLPSLPGTPGTGEFWSAGGSGSLAKSISSFIQRLAATPPAIRVTGGAKSPESMTVVRASEPASPGRSTTLRMELDNSEPQALTLRPVATGLIGDSGAQLPPHCVTCTPMEFTLGPGQRQMLSVSIQVPEDSVPGQYAGLLVLTGASQLRVVICIEVAPSALG